MRTNVHPRRRAPVCPTCGCKQPGSCAHFDVLSGVIMPSNPQARDWLREWNETNTQIANAMQSLGIGLAELCESDNDWTHEEEIIWYAFYQLEDCSSALGLHSEAQ